MLTDGKLERLEAAATKVTPGLEWFAHMDELKVYAQRPGNACINDQQVIALCATSEHAYDVARYIAEAQPAEVLALISELRALRAEMKAHAAAIARDRARWKADPLMKRLDDVRAHIAGMCPGDAEAVAQVQDRVLTAEAELTALRAQAPAPVEPFAWVVRTCEGNVRIWHRHREAIAERAAQMGSPLEPVYLSPPVGGEVVEARNVAHGVLLEAAWEAAAWLGAGDTVAEERLVPAILAADPDQAYARQALSELGFEVPALSPDGGEGR